MEKATTVDISPAQAVFIAERSGVMSVFRSGTVVG
jgi:hypothetical protein